MSRTYETRPVRDASSTPHASTIGTGNYQCQIGVPNPIPISIWTFLQNPFPFCNKMVLCRDSARALAESAVPLPRHWKFHVANDSAQTLGRVTPDLRGDLGALIESTPPQKS